MFSKEETIIMNMSGMYDEEQFDIPGARVLDLRHLAGTQCLCDEDSLDILRSTLAPLPSEGIHFIDGGDWHYLSLLWMEKVMEPFSLYLFDNHPDDQPTSFGEDVLSCGSWVLAARRSLPLLRDDVWINAAPGHLPGAAYISIDLDVLSKEYAVTNWDQGTMTLSELMEAISRIAANKRIIAVDICGGILPSQGACTCDLATNKGTRQALQEFLLNMSLHHTI